MRNIIYEKVMEFKNKFSGVPATRLERHAEVAMKSLAEGENVLHVYCGLDEFYRTQIVVVTDRRVIVARKKLLFGSRISSIDRDKVCNIHNRRSLLWNDIFFNTLTENFAYLHMLGDDATTEILKGFVSDKAEKKETTKKERRTHEEPVKSYQRESSFSLQGRIERCRALDALYREQYRNETDPEKKEQIKSKLQANYDYYCILTGHTPTLKNESPMMLLHKKANIR